MEQIQSSIKCSECKRILELPVILPCGESVCQKHTIVSQEANNGQEYHCVACNADHAIPVGGFYLNKALMKILETKIESLKLYHPDYSEAFRSCKDLEKSLEDFGLLQRDPFYFINKVIGDLKSEVEMLREEHKLSIDKKANDIVQQLNKFEQECKRNSNSTDLMDKLCQLEESNKVIKSQLDEWLNKCLANFDSSECKWKKIREDSQKHLRNLKLKINEFKSDFLLQRSLTDYQMKVVQFKRIELSSNKELAIQFDFQNGIKLDSKILEDTNAELKLLELCEFTSGEKWKLLYRASENGFLRTNFYDKCDKMSRTLTIVKAETTGNVFGGYTDVEWDVSQIDQFKADRNAFLFSLINKDNQPIKIKVSKEKEAAAVRCHYKWGPMFGDGGDLYIHDSPNANTFSYSSLGKAYKHPKYLFGTEQAKSFLAGSHQFKVAEIEIYQKI